MQIDQLKQISDDILKIAPRIRKEILDAFTNVKMGGDPNNEAYTPHAQDITTELDHKIGRIYIDEIFNKYPKQLSVDSEEESERVGKGKITMRFDPLDGSKHFFKGVPMLGSTVALVENEIAEFAMVIDVFSGNIYHAFKGGGAFLNGKKIHVSNHKISDDFSFLMYEHPNSKMFLTSPEKFDLFNKQLEIVAKNSYRMRNFGLSAPSICLVADGSCPAYIDFSGTTKLYDVEAAAMIALEAGAIVGDTEGNKENHLDHKSEGVKKLTGNLLIANPVAFDEISKLISNIR